jgi:hypothetical protein
LPGDLNRKIENAPHCCEVCSLTLDKRSKVANIRLELQEKANEDPTFISTIIMCDDWIYGYDPEIME